MTENIKEALQYSVELAGNEAKIVKGENNKEYYDSAKHSLRELDPVKYAVALKLTSLSSLIEYLKSEKEYLTEDEHLIVHVEDESTVKAFLPLDGERKRETLAYASAILPEFHFGRFYDTENFNIKLQSSFVATEDSEMLIEFASAIKIENGATIEDSGVSQTTTIRDGVASLSKARTPNPVSLKPYRTFVEVDQPESNFVFRISNEPACALFEADGGIWRIEAINNIRLYLEKELAELKNVTIIA